MSLTTANDIFVNGLDTFAIKLLPYWRIRFMGPESDLNRIFDSIIKVAPLVYGKTDRNAFLSASGIEYYRPMADTPTGAEEDTRKRPDIFEMALCIPRDELQLKSIIDIIYERHSYYEPPITVEPILRSATRGLDDSDNPHRWWNNEGDWKKTRKR